MTFDQSQRTDTKREQARPHAGLSYRRASSTSIISGIRRKTRISSPSPLYHCYYYCLCLNDGNRNPQSQPRADRRHNRTPFERRPLQPPPGQSIAESHLAPKLWPSLLPQKNLHTHQAQSRRLGQNIPPPRTRTSSAHSYCQSSKHNPPIQRKLAAR